MSNEGRALSLRGRNQDNSNRLDALEKDIPNILSGVSEGFMKLSGQLNELTEIVNALVGLVGEEDVAKGVTEARIAKAQEQSDSAKAALEKAVTEGKFEASETINETSVLVGIEKTKDGTVIPPGRAQLQFGTLLPDFKEQLLGQKIGFIVTTPPGGSFEITGIWNEVKKPVAEAAPVTTAVPVVEGEVLPPATELPAAPAVEVVQ